MTENELIEQLKQLKSVKPNSSWASWLKAEILNNQAAVREKAKVLAIKSLKENKFKPVVFSPFAFRYQAALIGLILCFFTGTIVLAQKASPTTALYPLKRLTQNIQVALAPQEKKPQLRLMFAQEKIDYLNKLQTQTDKTKLSYLTKEIKSDLAQASNSFKKINKPQKILVVSKDLENQAQKLEKSVIPTKPDSAEPLDQGLVNDIQNISGEILAVIGQTKELANQCPSYIYNQLEDLKVQINTTSLSALDVKSMIQSLAEVKKYLDANDCLSALNSLDEIRKNVLLKAIHPVDH